MATVAVMVEHNGTDYVGEINRVQQTYLGVEDHGVWTAMLTFDGQTAGCYPLDRYVDADDRRVGTAFGMDQIMAIVGVFCCRQWEAIKGLRCLVLRKERYGIVVGIADLTGERVLIFAEHAAQWEGI